MGCNTAVGRYIQTSSHDHHAYVKSRRNQQPALPAGDRCKKNRHLNVVFTFPPFKSPAHGAKLVANGVPSFTTPFFSCRYTGAGASSRPAPACVLYIGEQGPTDPSQLLQDPQDQAQRPGASRRSPSEEDWRRRWIACAERRRGRGGWGREVPERSEGGEEELETCCRDDMSRNLWRSRLWSLFHGRPPPYLTPICRENHLGNSSS